MFSYRVVSIRRSITRSPARPTLAGMFVCMKVSVFVIPQAGMHSQVDLLLLLLPLLTRDDACIGSSN